MKNKVKSIIALALCLCLAGCGGDARSISTVSDVQTSANLETIELESKKIKSFIESYNRYADEKFKINEAEPVSSYEAYLKKDDFIIGIKDESESLAITIISYDEEKLFSNFGYCIKALNKDISDNDIEKYWDETKINGEKGRAFDVCDVYYSTIDLESGTGYCINMYTAKTGAAETVAESSSKLTFELVAGEQGKYGKMISRNKNTEFEDNRMAYFVPYGTYKITNIGEYMTQVNVYSDETVINEDGWEEIADSVCNDVLDVGASFTVTVPENYHVEIGEPTHILMEQISDEVVEAETEPKVTTVTEEIAEDPIYEEVRVYLEDVLKNSYPDGKINHDKGTSEYEVEITLDGLKTDENPIKTEQDQEDWNEISEQFCEVSLLLAAQAIEKGIESPQIILFINSDDDIPKTVLTIMNGVVLFDNLSENTSIKTEKTVYITNTGKKYHSDSTCNGGDYFSATLSEAINQGLKPCEKCIG